MSKTIDAIRAHRYDPSALLGIVIAAAPDLIALALTSTDLPAWCVWGLRIAGVLLAAQGRPVLVK